MKSLIFDAGPLINFSMNGLLYVLEELKKNSDVEFLITKEVKKEVIDKPMTIRRFKLEALRMNDLYKKGVVKLADLSVKEVDELREIRDGLMDVANRSYKTKKKTLHLLDKGEAAALALAKVMKNKNGVDVPIAIDERTARMLVENPENLRKVLEKKFHTSVEADLKGLKSFEGFKVIRSTEIVYMAFKKGLTRVRGPKALEALLYGLRFKGASISDEEIVDYVGMK
ncbi:hypothetical protein CMI38_01620 [Candidatus Pacearchaeota archaeon]|jgi:protein involved in sex pheromone biosynthesis|nr:hypothetical protein [Candidatus Pacearchaeota archaeon]|tara:strand:- start:182 stop:862 length:681 start_codon:yes stop_codon:yes gene_type:complete